jgi:amylosucrase
VTDEDAAAVGWSGHAHRAFLSDFYEGGFPGTFAKGALFQVNPATGDKRISGTFASLAGLERAGGDPALAEMAVQRMLMGHALIAAFGGIPLIYMGDELALPNDYSYLDDPTHAHDSRWIHRPRMDWTVAEARHSGESASSRVFWGTKQILARRAATPALHAAVPVRVVPSGNDAVFAFQRLAPTGTLLCLFNFTEAWQQVPEAWARALGVAAMHDALSDHRVETHQGQIVLPPYARVWLT